jgi:hydrogenase expression/formation protein HypD
MTKHKTINLMEVCGTHTVAIARNGLRTLFPKQVTMLSGPGCPICVTPIEDIDRCIAIAGMKNTVVATFGDMLHVPGSCSSLEKERSKGADIRIVYSPVDALDLAAAEPEKNVVFLGVGFETTSPAIAATVLIARKRRLHNFTLLPMFKTVPNALRAILDIKERRIDGFLLPGHVSTIIGAEPYRFIAEEYGIPGVIGGFESSDILQSVELLVESVEQKKPTIAIQYRRSVSPAGNPAALATMEEVFEIVDSRWRAIGLIPHSGLAFRHGFKEFDASARFEIELSEAKEPKGCRCGEILLGLRKPSQCGLFGRRCTPRDPVGPCMVSSEGACAAEYKYGGMIK